MSMSFLVSGAASCVSVLCMQRSLFAGLIFSNRDLIDEGSLVGICRCQLPM